MKMGDVSGKKKLLIVDDVELFIQLQISHLGRERYEIHTAASGSEGLDLARSLKPDLVLLDLLMPDMDGDQVCRILKGDPETASIPVVIVSSGTRIHSKSIIETSGCDGLIYKPVRRDLLLSVVENLLQTNLRTHARVDITLSCTVMLEGKTHTGTLRSLSVSGAFVDLNLDFVRGDLLGLTFTLPVIGAEVKVRTAAVVWIGNYGKEGFEGAGVQFLTLDHDSKKRIEDFIHMHMDGDNLDDSGGEGPAGKTPSG